MNNQEDKKYPIINEIKSQGEKWVSIVRKFFNEEKIILKNIKKKSSFYFLASGSSYNNALMAEFAYNKLMDKKSYAINSSEYLFNPEVFYKTKYKDNKLFVISRTGETYDTLLALKKLKKLGPYVISLTTFPGSSIAKSSDFIINLEELKEESITSNRVVSSIALFFLCLFYKLGGKDNVLQEINGYSIKFFNNFSKYCSEISSIIKNSNYKKFIFLGTGPFYSVAREASLKTREMSISDTEFWPTLEYRQGYMTNTGKEDLAIVYLSKINRNFQFKTCEELKRAGSKVLIICDKENLKSYSDFYDFSFDIDLGVEDELLCQVYYQLFGQLIGYYQALKKNIDPSNPRNLDYIVKI